MQQAIYKFHAPERIVFFFISKLQKELFRVNHVTETSMKDFESIAQY